MTLIDTMEMYDGDLSEDLVGEAITSYEHEALFLVSKAFLQNAGKKRLDQVYENSLQLLQTDCLDMYLLHWCNSVPLEESCTSGNRSAFMTAAAQCVSDCLLPSCAGRNTAQPTSTVACIDTSGKGNPLHRLATAVGVPATFS